MSVRRYLGHGRAPSPQKAPTCVWPKTYFGPPPALHFACNLPLDKHLHLTSTSTVTTPLHCSQPFSPQLRVAPDLGWGSRLHSTSQAPFPHETLYFHPSSPVSDGCFTDSDAINTLHLPRAPSAAVIYSLVVIDEATQSIKVR